MSKKAHIMFVDDEQDNLDRMEIIGTSFPDIQFYLHLSQGGALKMLHRRNYLIGSVVLDISLEDGSGRETTELIRKHEQSYGHKTPIEIFWYTGWPIDLDDIYDPNTQTYYACDVRNLYVKAETDPVKMVEEIIEWISK